MRDADVSALQKKYHLGNIAHIFYLIAKANDIAHDLFFIARHENRMHPMLDMAFQSLWQLFAQNRVSEGEN